MFSLFIHIYHPDAWENIFLEKLKMLNGYSPTIIINLCMNHPGNSQLISKIKSDFPNALLITTPNKGRDIGGKLALIDFYLKAKQQSDYLVFLHDKQSHHWFGGQAWREKLFSIIQPEKIKMVLEEFHRNHRTGLIGASDFIKNEYDKQANKFKTTNNNKLKELVAKYSLSINDFSFVAGAMFWIRSTIIQKFFSEHSALSCREMLEEGNFTDLHEGTYTHSWERVFCWLANDQGYFLKGI